MNGHLLIARHEVDHIVPKDWPRLDRTIAEQVLREVNWKISRHASVDKYLYVHNDHCFLLFCMSDGHYYASPKLKIK